MTRDTYRPWTDAEIAKARKMLADGIPRYEIDRYFGRARSATWRKLKSLEDAEFRARNAARSREWRSAQSSGGGVLNPHVQQGVERRCTLDGTAAYSLKASMGLSKPLITPTDAPTGNQHDRGRQ